MSTLNKPSLNHSPIRKIVDDDSSGVNVQEFCEDQRPMPLGVGKQVLTVQMTESQTRSTHSICGSLLVGDRIPLASRLHDQPSLPHFDLLYLFDAMNSPKQFGRLN